MFANHKCSVELKTFINLNENRPLKAHTETTEKRLTEYKTEWMRCKIYRQAAARLTPRTLCKLATKRLNYMLSLSLPSSNCLAKIINWSSDTDQQLGPRKRENFGGKGAQKNSCRFYSGNWQRLRVVNTYVRACTAAKQ